MYFATILFHPLTIFQIYSDYDALKAHFKAKHFLCEDEGCAEEKFTSVFRTEIDLRGKAFLCCFSFHTILIFHHLLHSSHSEYAWQVNGEISNETGSYIRS